MSLCSRSHCFSTLLAIGLRAGGFFSGGRQPLGLRRRNAAITAANSPPTPLEAIGAELADVAKAAVAKVANIKLTGARQWVTKTLTPSLSSGLSPATPPT
jgi:hypothetical protein